MQFDSFDSLASRFDGIVAQQVQYQRLLLLLSEPGLAGEVYHETMPLPESVVDAMGNLAADAARVH
jgi:hypothetical protein